MLAFSEGGRTLDVHRSSALLTYSKSTSVSEQSFLAAPLPESPFSESPRPATCSFEQLNQYNHGSPTCVAYMLSLTTLASCAIMATEPITDFKSILLHIVTAISTFNLSSKHTISCANEHPEFPRNVIETRIRSSLSHPFSWPYQPSCGGRESHTLSGRTIYLVEEMARRHTIGAEADSVLALLRRL